MAPYFSGTTTTPTVAKKKPFSYSPTGYYNPTANYNKAPTSGNINGYLPPTGAPANPPNLGTDPQNHGVTGVDTSKGVLGQYVDAFKSGGFSGMGDLFTSRNAGSNVSKYLNAWRNGGIGGLKDKYKEMTGSDYENYTDTIGQRDQDIYDKLGIISDNVDNKAPDMNADVTAGIKGLNSSNYEDVLAGRTADRAKYGPYGSRYSGYEDTALNNAQDMASNDYLDTQAQNFAKIKSTIQGEKTPLELAYEKNALLAQQGGLTDPNNQVYQAQSALYDKAAEDAIRKIKEEEGAQRGIGGGRSEKLMAETANDLGNQKMAALTELQKQQADQAPSYITTNKGLENDLTKTGVDWMQGLDSTKAGANAQVLGQINNAGQLDLSQANQEMQNQQNRYGMDKDSVAMLQDQNFGQMDRDLAERLGVAGVQSGIADKQYGNTLATGQLYQNDYLNTKDDPGTAEKIMTGIGNFIQFGGQGGIAQLAKDLGVTVQDIAKFIPMFTGK